MIIEGKIFPYKKTLTRLFECASEILEENFSNVCVSINFVDAEKIRGLNKNFRNIDRKTDVLSFPNLEKKVDQKLSEFDNERNFDDGFLFLGDIIVCKEVAKAQAKEYGHSKKREICFLALHSLLHLLGYDHIEKEDERLMNDTAEKILNQFGVRR